MGVSSRVLAIGVCVGGCVRTLPPAAVPQPVAPSLEPAPPPPEGQGRLVVDVVEGRAPVQRIKMESRPVTDAQGRTRYSLFEVPEPFCSPAPCAVDVPQGNVLLGFPVIGNRDALEVDLVHVGREPTVYRRSLSVYTPRAGGLAIWGIVGASLGGTSMIAGTALLPIGLSDGNSALTTAGAVTLGAGALVLGLGILALRHDANTFRPGSSNHFSLEH